MPIGASVAALLLCEAAGQLFKGQLTGVATVVREDFECRRVDPLLGGGFKPDCTSRWRLSTSSKTIFDVRFSTNRRGNRRVPGVEKLATEHLALFFGCFFTLGTGVNDDETLPYYFSRATGIHSLNLGGSGFGPQQMLAVLDETNFAAELPKTARRKTLLYHFIDLHVDRAVGAPSPVSFYARYFPNYVEDENGSLVRRGTLGEAHPVWSALSEMFGWSMIYKAATQLVSNQGAPEDIAMTAKILIESARKFREKFKSDEFYVVFYPSTRPKIQRQVQAYLESAGVRTINLSKLFDLHEEPYHLADGHPSALAHRLVAEAVEKELKFQ